MAESLPQENGERAVSQGLAGPALKQDLVTFSFALKDLIVKSKCICKLDTRIHEFYLVLLLEVSSHCPPLLVD